MQKRYGALLAEVSDSVARQLTSIRASLVVLHERNERCCEAAPHSTTQEERRGAEHSIMANAVTEFAIIAQRERAMIEPANGAKLGVRFTRIVSPVRQPAL